MLSAVIWLKTTCPLKTGFGDFASSLEALALSLDPWRDPFSGAQP